MQTSTPRQPLRGASLSSVEIDVFFPHVASIIYRGSWTFSEHGDLNSEVQRLGEYRCENFNSFARYHFEHPEQADALTEYALARRLHRKRNSTHGASREEFAMEWERIDAEREEILAWGRTTGMLREAVQSYRFERHRGSYSNTAHEAAAKRIEEVHPTITDPLYYAGVPIEWSEKEHRAWFWRCCRDHHLL